MRIAFDLDDTLVRCGKQLPTSAPRGVRRAFCSEPLRVGAADLLHALVRAGHEIGVYTSSERSRARVWLNFWSYGVTLGHVVNKTVHDTWWRRLDAHHRNALAPCLKYPPAFGIDLLVDDSEAVASRGRELGYRVLVVSPENDDWCAQVWRAVSEV
ncbi:Hypothetical protein A7982_10943 [Minicystis rosea]|nr:Hypothetical protein A7982_10943 [Minicystis rosea]